MTARISAVSSQQLCAELGITCRQLDHWVRAGYLQLGPAAGSGHPRTWPPGEIRVAKRMAYLAGTRIPDDDGGLAVSA